MSQRKKLKTDDIGSFSKNLLGLKFMQRARQEAEKLAKEKKEEFHMETKQQFVTYLTYPFCENLKFGRFSFNGMNEDIEAIMYRNDPNSVALPTPYWNSNTQ